MLNYTPVHKLILIQLAQKNFSIIKIETEAELALLSKLKDTALSFHLQFL